MENFTFFFICVNISSVIILPCETFYKIFRLDKKEGIIGGLDKNEKNNEEKYYIP